MNLRFWRESPAERRHKELVLQGREIINQIKNMAIKVSELGAEVGGLSDKVVKIWGEQQTKYDALVVLYNDALAQLANQTIGADAQDALDKFKAKLQEFDDAIPDTTA